MIIKLTFQDNDFTGILETFSTNLVMRLLKRPMTKTEQEIYHKRELSKDSLSKEENDALMEYFKAEFDYSEQMNKILNPNLCEFPNKEQINMLEDCIRLHFEKFIDTLVQKNERIAESKKYLMDELAITVTQTYKDKWENGEVLYYSTTNNKYFVN